MGVCPATCRALHFTVRIMGEGGPLALQGGRRDLAAGALEPGDGLRHEDGAAVEIAGFLGAAAGVADAATNAVPVRARMPSMSS